MESISPHIISASLPLAGFVGILIFHRILNWVSRIQKLNSSFPSLPQSHHDFASCESKHWVETKNQNPELASKQFGLHEERDEWNLSREDVEMVMENLGIFCKPNERIQERLGFEEFSVLFDNKEPSLEEVKEAFDVFDQNKDGFIDAMELQSVLHSLGFSKGSEMKECRRMIETFDTNRDGKIDFIEFLKLAENSF